MIFLSKYVVLLEDISDLVSPLASSPSVLGWGGGIFIVFAMYTAKWEGRGGGSPPPLFCRIPFPPPPFHLLLFLFLSRSFLPPSFSFCKSRKREREKGRGKKFSRLRRGNFPAPTSTFVRFHPRAFFFPSKSEEEKKTSSFFGQQCVVFPCCSSSSSSSSERKKGGAFPSPLSRMLSFPFLLSPPPFFLMCCFFSLLYFDEKKGIHLTFCSFPYISV